MSRRRDEEESETDSDYDDYSEEESDEEGSETDEEDYYDESDSDTEEESESDSESDEDSSSEDEEIKVPDRKQTGFNFFCSKKRTELRNKHPNWSVSDLSRELELRWNMLSKEERQKYSEKAKN